MPSHFYWLISVFVLLVGTAGLVHTAERYPTQALAAWNRTATLRRYCTFWIRKVVDDCVVQPLAHWLHRREYPPPPDRPMEGRHVIPIWEVYGDSPGHILVGSLHLLPKAMCDGLFIFGRRNSGKTTLLKSIYMQVFKKIPGLLGLIFDCKHELLEFFKLLGIPTADLFPFRPNSVAPDLDAYFTDDAVIDSWAEALFPREPGSSTENEHWRTSTVRVIATLIKGRKEKKGRVTLRYIVNAISHGEARLIAVLSCSTAGRSFLRTRVRPNSREWTSVLATLDSLARHLGPVAGAWAKAEREGRVLNVKAFANKHTTAQVLVAAYDKSREDSLRVCNQIWFEMVTSVLMGPDRDSNAQSPVAFIGLDEAARVNFRGLKDTAELSRSYGVILALGAQSLPGLNVVYGTDTTLAILGALSIQVFLGLSCAVTAKLAEDQLGQRTIWEVTGPETGSSCTGPAVLASAFLSIAPASLEAGITGAFIYGDQAQLYNLPGTRFPPLTGTTPGSLPAPKLRDWSLADLKAEGLWKNDPEHITHLDPARPINKRR